MIRISLEEDRPLVDQFVTAFKDRIEDRILRPGTRLPPIRVLAESHGVSRFTVVEAYDRLVALGYLRSRRGSGFYVEARPAATPATVNPGGHLARAFDNAGVLHQSLANVPGQLKVGVGWLPAAWHDDEGIRRHLRTLTRRDDVPLTGYGTAQGYAPLREHLQRRLGEIASLAVPPNQIVLTSGATQALDLIARLLLSPGDCVLVDDPGYWNLFANLRLQGVQLVGVPRREDGPDVAALEGLLAEHRPKAFFTHSVLHNPTSSNLSPACAFRLLQLAERHGLLLVEDDTYGDFHPGQATRLATLDQLQRVIYVGSFSKTLSANLRVGFLAASPDLAARLTDIKIVSCVATPELAERLVYEMLIEGHFRKYMERLHGRLTQATQATLAMLERVGLTAHREPEGGMFVWARIPGEEDAVGLATRAAAQGIMLAPGGIFSPQQRATPYLRLNVAYCEDPRLERFFGDNLGA